MRTLILIKEKFPFENWVVAVVYICTR